MAVEVLDLRNYRPKISERVPEGEYVVRISEIEQGRSKGGDPMWTVFTEIADGDYAGSQVIDRITLTERALFRVVGFLNALGVKTPRKRIQVDPAKLVGKKYVAEIADGDPYKGRVNSEIREYRRIQGGASDAAEPEMDLDALDGSEEADEAPAPKKGKGKKKKAKKADPEVETPQEKNGDPGDPWAVGTTSDDGSIDLDSVEL